MDAPNKDASEAMDHEMVVEQQEEMEEPVYVDPNDVVEVAVDDDNEPMDEEEDEQGEQEPSRQETVVVEDMSKFQFHSHSGPVYTVALSKESIASGGGDDAAYLHTVKGSSSLRIEHAFKDTVSSVLFNHEYTSQDLEKTPKYMAVGCYDGSILIYNDGVKFCELEGPSDVEWMAFHSKGGTVLLVGSLQDATVWMYHLPQQKCLQVFVGHEGPVSCGGFTKDGKWALSGSMDGTVKIWAPKTGLCKHTFAFNQDPVLCMDIGGGSDSNLVLVGTEGGMAHVCHVGSKKVVASMRHYEIPANAQEEEELPTSVEAVGFFTSNTWCATGGVDGTLKIWDLSNQQCRHVCSVQGGVTRLKWHPRLPIVFASTAHGTVSIWDARNGNLLHTLTGHVDAINDLAVEFVDEAEAVICTAGDDEYVRVFEINLNDILQQQTK